MARALCILLQVMSVSMASYGSATLLDDDAAGQESPVNRVIQLLREMKSQLEAEAARDSETYQKMTCWCETNKKQKTQAVADADGRLQELQTEIETTSARDGELSAKIAQLKKDLDKEKQGLLTARSIREKEAAKFTATEKEMVEVIATLKNAIFVLSRNSAGLVQMTPAMQESMRTALRWVALKRDEMLEISRKPAAKKSLRSTPALLSVGNDAANANTDIAQNPLWAALQGESSAKSGEQLPAEFARQLLAEAAQQANSGAGSSFAQAPGDFDQKPTHLRAYASQSGEIVGLLKRMQEEFTENLSTEQKEELQAREEYAELKKAKDAEIAASTKKLDEMESEFAANTKALSDAKEELASTGDSRAADVQFLSDLNLQCQALDNDWQKRSKARGEEIVAVGDAVAILTEDDARDLFGKKFGSAHGFLQLSAFAAAERAARSRVAEQLIAAAHRVQPANDDGADLEKMWRAAEAQPHAQLAQMAVRVKLDGFEKVKQAIDSLVADLKVQQENEVAHKAQCTSSLQTNEKETYTTEQALADAKDAIAEHEATIEKLEAEMAKAQKTIAETKVEVKAAGEARAKENADFQEEVTDQRAVQNILKKAIARLSAVYQKQAALAQQDPVSPHQFQPYKQNAGASGVLSMLEQVVGDAVKVEQEAMAGEQESQKAYETFVKDANDSIDKSEQTIETCNEQKSTTAVEKEKTEALKADTEQGLADLNNVAADLHADCDFTMKNFDIRQKARQQEMDALQSAKASLSGMIGNR